MQTHEDNRFYFYCDTPGCARAYRTPPSATQQDGIALSSLDGWLHVGAASYCPDHAEAGVDFPTASFPLTTLPVQNSVSVEETPETLGTETTRPPGAEDISGAEVIPGAENTPVQPGAGELSPSPAEEAETPPKADDAAEPLATESHEGPEASTQSS